MRQYRIRGLSPQALEAPIEFEEPSYEPYGYNIRGLGPPRREQIDRDINLTSRYDTNLSPGEVQEYNRAQNQGWLNKVSSGFISRGASIAPKIGQGIGHVGGFVYEAANAMAASKVGNIPGAMDISGIWDNFVVDMMSEADEQLRQKLPVFGDERYYEGNILQQMGTAKFWADDFFDALAFAASAYLPGAAAGAAGKALGLTGNALKGFQLGSSTIYNTISESGFEALDLGKQARNDYAFEKFGLPYEELDDAKKFEVRLKIAPEQANTFMANAAVLAIPNYIQSRFFHGGFSQNAQRLRRAVQAGEISAKDVSLFQSAYKNTFAGIASEGLWEEGIQNAVQRYEQRRISGKAEEGFFAGVGYEWLDGFNTPEGQKGMILGALVGGMMGFRSGVIDALSQQKAVTEIEEREKALINTLDNYDKIYTDLLKDIHRTWDTQTTEIVDGEERTVTGRSYVDENGNMELDPIKANKLFYHRVNDKFLFDESMVAHIEGDELHNKMVNDDVLARRFFGYMSAVGTIFEDRKEAIEALKARELQFPEEGVPEEISRSYTDRKITELTALYDRVEKDLLDVRDFEKDELRLGFKNIVRKTLFGEGAKRQTLSDMKSLTENEQALEQLDILIEDSQSISRDILNKKTRENLFDTYKKEVNQLNDLQSELRKLESAETRDEEAIRNTRFEFDEHRYIEGVRESNTVFPYAVSMSSLLGELGARNQYYFETGMDAMVDQRVDQMLADVEKGTGNIADALNYITDTRQGRSRIRKEDIDKVRASLLREGERVEELATQALESQQWLDANPETVFKVEDGVATEEIPNPNYDPEAAAYHRELVEEAERRRRQLGEANFKYDELSETVQPKTERKRFATRQSEERFFRRQFGDKAVKAAKGINDAYRANENAYSSISEVRDVVKQLNELKRVYGKDPRKKMLETKEFKGFMDSVNQALKDLRAIEKKVQENFANREAKDRRSKENNDNATFLSIGIRADKKSKTFTITDPDTYNAIVNAVGKNFFDSVMEDAKKSERPFDGIYAEKIIDKVKELKKQKDVLDVVESKRTVAVEEMIDRIKQTKFYKERRGIGVVWPFKSYRQNPFKLFDVIVTATLSVKIKMLLLFMMLYALVLL
jgi:hypothetical protein